MPAYNEDTLVQQTTADYLENSLGWRSVYAYNQEDFGPDSLLGRTSDREVVLRRTLRQKMAELNPGHPEEAYDDAVRQLAGREAAQALVSTNQEKYELIRNGVQVAYQNANGEQVKPKLRVIDYDEPTNNDFLCVRELWVRGDLYRRRADIMGFINGLPLLFIECKAIHKNLRTAFEQNFSDYLDTIPHIFHHNAIVMFGNGEKAKIGSITSKWEHFYEWKRLAEDEPGVVDMETLLKGVFDKSNLIDLIENFILFDESSGEAKKIVARNHQFLGVNLAMESVRDRKQRDGKLGVFWHTQGAGKSYSMVFFTQKVRRKLGGNFSFVVLTDRDDLDTQLYKTFAGCGVVDNDKDPCRASDGKHLRSLMGQHKAYVFSLIQKFNQEVDPDDGYTRRDDVIVITDEAHRTQYGTLALNMRNALPLASFIGFTGTPLFSDDEVTAQVFGEYVSTYDFQRAVDDRATLPLYYDARGDRLVFKDEEGNVHTVSAPSSLNEKIASKIDELGIDDINTEQRLEQALKKDYHIVTSSKRLDQVARDFVEHYSTSWQTGKAMMVCMDKVTCVRMYDLILKYWKEKTEEIRAEVAVSALSTEEEQLKATQLKWMETTQTAVVVSEEQGEVAKFKKWGLKIRPHRRLTKEGVELPEEMRKKEKFRNMQVMDIDEAFKEEEHPLRIAIVCAMWLTGFDVPSLSTLYLDKPLKAHTLMQAIARANRVHSGKNNGMIVDYCGILKHLRRALSTFAGRTSAGGGSMNPARPEEELLGDLAEAIFLVRRFLADRDAPLDAVQQQTGFARNAAIVACKEVANENDETRKRFEIMCREVLKKFKACLMVEGVNTYRGDRDAINVVYKSLQKDRELANISDIIRELHKVVDGVIETQPDAVAEDSEPYDISKIDFERLKQEFQRTPAKRTTVQNVRTAIEQKLRKLLTQNPLRTNFQRHYEDIVAEYNREKDRVTIERTFEALMRFIHELDEEDERSVREGLDEESLAVFDLLKKDTLTPTEIKKIKQVAVELLNTLKSEKLRIDQWRKKESSRDAVKQAIHDFLWSDKTGLPVETYDEEDVEARAEEVFRHVFRAYPTIPSPFYVTESRT